MLRTSLFLDLSLTIWTPGKCMPVVFDSEYVGISSFIWRGMVNSLNLALLTGDRSLVDVVVHELTHSWFGNGVTLVPHSFSSSSF
jgi:hypothetical protein